MNHQVGQQNCEDKEHHYTTCIHGYLHGSQKLVAELEIEHGSAEQHEKQVGSGTQYLARRHCLEGEHHHDNGNYEIHDYISY